MKPWGYRHPVITWALVAISVLLFLSFEAAGIIFGLIGLAGAYLLFGRPGMSSASKRQLVAQANSYQPGAAARTTPELPKRTPKKTPSAMSMQRLTALPTSARIAIVNMLEPDEEPHFVLLGTNMDGIVGTDQRLLVIPEGRNGWERIWGTPYGALVNVQLEQQKNGARLLIGSQQRMEMTPILRLAGDAQIEGGINAVQGIRRRIAEAQQTSQEESSPIGQSALIETAHISIPTAYAKSSLSLGDMLEMNPTEFELFTGRALESLGYTNVHRVGGSGDLSADLTATDPQGRSAIVQCKRYTPGSKVGSPALQSFIGMKSIHHRADRGIFVTTADYSQQAIDLAKEHGIVLIDGDDLVKIAALVLTPSAPKRNQNDSGTGVFFCPNCGNKQRTGTRYCSVCGADLSSTMS